MKLTQQFTGNWSVIKKVFRWSLLTLPSSFVIGNVIALLLWAIDKVTLVRLLHPQIIWFLPVAGIAIYFLIRAFRETSSNIVLQNIHDASNGVTERSSLPVFLTTVITHLFGGSAGREGTTFQIGASLSRFSAKLFRLSEPEFKVVCTSGIAAAFGAIFGVPIAGAFFALEIVREGRFPYNALIPCMVASIVGTLTCNYWGVHLTQFQYIFSSQSHPMFNGNFTPDLLLLAKAGTIGVIMGLLCCLFYLVLQYIKHWVDKSISPKWVIPFVGGILLVALYYVFGTQQYLGLGVAGMGQNAVSIASAFGTGGVDTWSWLIKLLFVIITLSFGFRGGEVTPLLFIGATLGSVLAIVFNAPVPLFAALGFITVLGGSANTPFAATILGMELFGAEYTSYYAFACFIAYFFSPTRKKIERLERPTVPKLFDADYLKEWSLDREIENERLERKKDKDEPSYLEEGDERNNADFEML